MPARELDACFYASEAPSIEFREGMFIVGYTVGRCHFEFAMSPNVFLKTRRKASAAIDAFERGVGTKVAPLRKEKEGAAH